LPREEFVDGIRYVRIRAGTLPAAPYRLVKSLRGLVKLARDVFGIARKVNDLLEEESFDVVHVYFPFAFSILVSLNKELKEKMAYTTRIREEGKSCPY
jgi:hypothetical protein